jgi:hypothetical protein
MNVNDILSQVVTLPIWILILYLIFLISIVVTFYIMEAKYYWIKYELKHYKEKTKVNITENRSTSHF